MQQHRRAIRLREASNSSATACNWTRSTSSAGVGTGVVDYGMAIVTRCCCCGGGCERQVGDDARASQFQRLIDVGCCSAAMLPCVLRDVVGECGVLHQCAREVAHPGHLGQQLLASRDPRVVHRPSPVICRCGPIVRDNFDETVGIVLEYVTLCEIWQDRWVRCVMLLIVLMGDRGISTS